MALPARSPVRAQAVFDAPDDNQRWEVIDGEWVVSAAPKRIHQHAVTVLAGEIWSYLADHRLGTIYVAPIAVIFDAFNGVEPDLVFVSRQRESILTDDGVEGTPDLVVEILSPSTSARDRGDKMQLYARFGVAHLWLGVPETRSLEAYRLSDAGYELTGTHGPGTVFHPELFPGLRIEIDGLWP